MRVPERGIEGGHPGALLDEPRRGLEVSSGSAKVGWSAPMRPTMRSAVPTARPSSARKRPSDRGGRRCRPDERGRRSTACPGQGGRRPRIGEARGRIETSSTCACCAKPPTAEVRILSAAGPRGVLHVPPRVRRCAGGIRSCGSTRRTGRPERRVVATPRVDLLGQVDEGASRSAFLSFRAPRLGLRVGGVGAGARRRLRSGSRRAVFSSAALAQGFGLCSPASRTLAAGRDLVDRRLARRPGPARDRWGAERREDADGGPNC